MDILKESVEVHEARAYTSDMMFNFLYQQLAQLTAFWLFFLDSGMTRARASCKQDYSTLDIS